MGVRAYVKVAFFGLLDWYLYAKFIREKYLLTDHGKHVLDLETEMHIIIFNFTIFLLLYFVYFPDINGSVTQHVRLSIKTHLFSYKNWKLKPIIIHFFLRITVTADLFEKDRIVLSPSSFVHFFWRGLYDGIQSFLVCLMWKNKMLKRYYCLHPLINATLT